MVITNVYFDEPEYEEEYLEHYGTKRHSGRYPWGSGKNPRSALDLYSQYKQLSQYMSDSDIAEGWGMSKDELLSWKSIGRDAAIAAKVAEVNRRRYDPTHPQSVNAIAQEMGENESTIRSWLNPASMERRLKTRKTADAIKDLVDEHGYVDVSKGSELELGVSHTKLKTALRLMESEGYQVNQVDIPQLGTHYDTTFTVVTKEGVPWGDIRRNYDKWYSIGSSKVIDENGDILPGKSDPIQNISRDRVYIRYAEDGGKELDGTIELRRGVPDLNLGSAHYAQVRIGVDGKYYLKGMALNTDDIPEGYDIVFNTNKKRGTPDADVFKPQDISDPSNPFGSALKPDANIKRVQRRYLGEDGKVHTSALNIVHEEGDWDEYKQSLPSQFLSKQKRELIQRQLDLSYAQTRAEYSDICSLTNPTLKKKLLADFAENCDAKAVDLKAAALPRQATKVILPSNSVKPNEIFAPGYKNGEHVVLIRYPHAGIFEIPDLVVNNKVKDAQRKIGTTPMDAVMINSKTAAQLSGADFDGDTVVVIPANNPGGGPRIDTKRYFESLQNFEPKDYKWPDNCEHKKMTKRDRGMEMGRVTNLITDMTFQGATDEEIIRATKHSMVVIDAYKHDLNYKQSEKDFDISSLKAKYQQKENGKYGGAGTLISRAKSPQYIDQRVRTFGITSGNTNPETGERIFKSSGRHYTKTTTKTLKDGTVKTSTKVIYNQEQIPWMAKVSDARELMSVHRYPKEQLYAKYANDMKSLANQARKEYLATSNIKRKPEATKRYSSEVASLNKKVVNVQKNAPKERQATLLANQWLSTWIFEHGGKQNIDSEDLRKKKGQLIIKARDAVGAHKPKIDISPNEWEAIQAGAIGSTKLRLILDNADPKVVKEYATPRNRTTLPESKQQLIKTLANSGYTQSEIADRIGVSVSTIKPYL